MIEFHFTFNSHQFLCLPEFDKITSPFSQKKRLKSTLIHKYRHKLVKHMHLDPKIKYGHSTKKVKVKKNVVFLETPHGF